MCVSKGWAVYMKCSSQDQVFIGEIYVNSSIPREGGGYIYVWVGVCNPDGVYVHVVEDFWLWGLGCCMLWVGVSDPGGWILYAVPYQPISCFLWLTLDNESTWQWNKEISTYTRSLRKSGLLNTPFYSPHHPSSITLTDTRLSVRIHHVDEFRDLEYIPVPGFIFLSNLPIFYRILRSHR